MCTSGRKTTACVAALFFLAAGCGEDKKLSIAVEFPNDQARAATYAVRVMVILPGPGSTCTALLDGTANPDGPGYPIEDQIDIVLPAEKGSRPLDLGEPGARLFFAQARDVQDTIILHGCEEADASWSGPSVVTIALNWVTDPCTADDGCDDGDICTQNLCNLAIGHCVYPPVTVPPGREGPYQDPTCADNLDNDCDGQIDGDDTECKACTLPEECNDSNVCTDDLCDNNSVCSNPPVADGSTCDDGNYCTSTDTCTAGMCGGTGSPCIQQCMTVCNEASDTCTPSPAGTACPDDGQYCNGAEACDGAGSCGHSGNPCVDADCSTCLEDTDACSVDHAMCNSQTPGSRCLPGCASNSSGCVLPPDSLSLNCADPTGGLEATCTVMLTGTSAVGQESCMTCSAEAGVAVIDFADFDNGSGQCDLDGWQLVPSTPQNCKDKADNCSITGANRACCDNFNTVCDAVVFGSPVLKSCFITNCGGGFKQWRIQKSFDLSNVSAPWICFDAADRGALDSSAVMVYAEDPIIPNTFQQIFCFNGGPQEGVDDFFYSNCVDLPAWAAGNANVTVTFVLHSDTSNEYLFIRNIAVKGWVGACSPAIQSVLQETFTGCDTGAWTFSGGTQTCNPVGCSNHPAWAPGIFGSGAPFVMDTTVDASALDCEVTACMQIGGVLPGASDRVSLRYNTGTGFRDAWTQTVPLGVDGQCREICVNLSELDPAVNNHSALGLRIGVDSAGGIGVFGVSVTGAQNCPIDDTLISFSDFAGDGSGNYQFTATDLPGVSLDAAIICQWDSDPNLTGQDTVHFRP